MKIKLIGRTKKEEQKRQEVWNFKKEKWVPVKEYNKDCVDCLNVMKGKNLNKRKVLERVLDLLSKIDTDKAQQLYQDVGVIWAEVENKARRELLEQILKRIEHKLKYACLREWLKELSKS